MPSRSSTVARTALASGSSMASTRFIPSMIATLTPNLANTWESSSPIGPPPRMISEGGRCSTLTASRFVQYSTSPRPGIGGIAGEVPVANTTALVFETLHRDPVIPVVGRFSSDPAGDRIPIRRHRRVSGKAWNATTLRQHVVRSDPHLGGDAAVIGAFAAHQVAFDADHLETVFGEAFGDFLAAHTHAENDGVDLFSHFAWRRWSWPVEPPPQPPPAPDRESGLAPPSKLSRRPAGSILRARCDPPARSGVARCRFRSTADAPWPRSPAASPSPDPRRLE